MAPNLSGRHLHRQPAVDPLDGLQILDGTRPPQVSQVLSLGEVACLVSLPVHDVRQVVLDRDPLSQRCPSLGRLDALTKLLLDGLIRRDGYGAAPIPARVGTARAHQAVPALLRVESHRLAQLDGLLVSCRATQRHLLQVQGEVLLPKQLPVVGDARSAQDKAPTGPGGLGQGAIDVGLVHLQLIHLQPLRGQVLLQACTCAHGASAIPPPRSAGLWPPPWRRRNSSWSGAGSGSRSWWITCSNTWT